MWGIREHRLDHFEKANRNRRRPSAKYVQGRWITVYRYLLNGELQIMVLSYSCACNNSYIVANMSYRNDGYNS